jgi:hypothetical protein
LLFKQKETQGSVVYGNAVIRAFYVPKSLVEEIGTPEQMYVELTPANVGGTDAK